MARGSSEREVYERLECVRRRKQGDPWHMHELLAQAPEARRGLGVQHRDIQENKESLDDGHEEAVPGDVERRSHIEGEAAEEVHHEDGGGGRGEEVTEVGVGDAATSKVITSRWSD